MRNGNATIVQSIEGPPLSPKSLRRLQHGEDAHSEIGPQPLSPKRAPARHLFNGTNGITHQLSRKRKLDDYDLDNGVSRQPLGEIRVPARTNGLLRQQLSAYPVYDFHPTERELRHLHDAGAGVRHTRDQSSLGLQFDAQDFEHERASPPHYKPTYKPTDSAFHRSVVIDRSLGSQTSWTLRRPLTPGVNLAPQYQVADTRATHDAAAISLHGPAPHSSSNRLSYFHSNGTGERQIESFSTMRPAQSREVVEILPEDERYFRSGRREPQMLPSESRDRMRLSDSFISRAQSPLRLGQPLLPLYRSHEDLRPVREAEQHKEPLRDPNYTMRPLMVDERYDIMLDFL